MLRLKEILTEKNLSEQDLANLLGVSRQYVNSIVMERRSCSLETLKKIATVLNVPLAVLFDSYVPPVMSHMYVGSLRIPNTNMTLYLFLQGVNE